VESCRENERFSQQIRRFFAGIGSQPWGLLTGIWSLVQARAIALEQE